MGSFRLVVAKMKRKTTEKVSKYQLIDNDVSQHPTYEQMIQEVLENSKSNTGIRRKTIYHRIKQNYNLEDRYAKPAMNNALKNPNTLRRLLRRVPVLAQPALQLKPRYQRTTTKNPRNPQNPQNLPQKHTTLTKPCQPPQITISQ